MPSIVLTAVPVSAALTRVREKPVDCPDAQTAARVLAAGGKKATAITDTVTELAGSKHDAALFRKLDAMGIFGNQSKPSAKKSHKKRSRRRRW